MQIIVSLHVCVVQPELVEAELSCSGPEPDGIERGMKGKDKRRGWGVVGGWGGVGADHWAERKTVLVKNVCVLLELQKSQLLGESATSAYTSQVPSGKAFMSGSVGAQRRTGVEQHED